jgi:type VI secretion system protein ImpA
VTANRVAAILREVPITREGLNYYQYKESRAIGYEADAQYNEAKTKQREQAIADGKPTGEDFDKSVANTPKAWYVQMSESFRSSLETLEELQIFCEEKYRDDGPGFSKLRASLEEVGQVANALLNEKRKTEPDEVVADAEPEPEPEQEAVAEAAVAEDAPKAKAKPGKSLSAEPVDKDDAIARIQACARFFQTDNAASPVAYLLQTSLRLGEMREQGSGASYDFLVPPATEIRQNLKRLAAESNWGELLSAAVIAAGDPCGRAWLDVHRYIWRASYECGYAGVSGTVITTLQSLIKDIPEISTWTLSDDTPTANPETQRWLEEMVIPKPLEPVIIVKEPEPAPGPVHAAPARQQGEEAAEPDVLQLARDLMARGQLPQAIQLLMRDAAQQSSGRGRFQRRLQMAQMCVNAGQGKVAYPVLEELVREIDQRQLEEWEVTDMIAPPFALLLRCLGKNGDDALRESLFARLCRIDPIAAMDISR